MQDCHVVPYLYQTSNHVVFDSTINGDDSIFVTNAISTDLLQKLHNVHIANIPSVKHPIQQHNVKLVMFIKLTYRKKFPLCATYY